MKQFLQWSALTMDTPKSYGTFHITFFIVGLIVSIAVALFLRKKSDKTIKIFLFVYGIILGLLEIYKQLFYIYIVADGTYPLWIFPFQLCSVPMYLCIIQFFIKSKKINNAIYNFILAFSFFSGFVTFLEPSGINHSYWFLTLHAYTWHISLVLLGLVLFCNKKAGNRLKDFVPASIVYGIVLVIAEIINISLKSLGEINMFYISPYFRNPIIVFKTLYMNIGWLPCAILYSLSIMLGAFIFFSIFVGIRKLLDKKQKSQDIIATLSSNDADEPNTKISESL